ncbi:hypothetical protein TWF696_006188 [Orbilia brochopaga]|uniref:Uncharacterized protein n=1 Tax=Orbilia brochopaga TaxID=3140254 RepID=A0AAV9UWD1_9PEZI
MGSNSSIPVNVKTNPSKGTLGSPNQPNGSLFSYKSQYTQETTSINSGMGPIELVILAGLAFAGGYYYGREATPEAPEAEEAQAEEMLVSMTDPPGCQCEETQ